MKIYECPICHRKFSESESIIGTTYKKPYKLDLIYICECPKCFSKLIKSDSGEYIEYED